MKTDNPFQEYGYFGPEYFCDREKETQEIISALRNGSNITLLAPRRIGKTGLIKHVFHHLELEDTDATCFYVDIFPTKNLQQLTEAFANAIIGKLDSRRPSIRRKLEAFTSSLRPTMSFDKLDGMPNFNFNVALKSLTEKELLYHDTAKGYIVYDRFFGIWLQRL